MNQEKSGREARRRVRGDEASAKESETGGQRMERRRKRRGASLPPPPAALSFICAMAVAAGQSATVSAKVGGGSCIAYSSCFEKGSC